jgi:UDP-glucose 4-epimerase
MKRVVVTGAFGYVGLALLGRLARAGLPVIGIGHPPRAQAPVPAGVQAVHGDTVLAETAIDADSSLVHLAGGGGEAACRKDPVAAVKNIIGATMSLAGAARRAGAATRIYASTIAVYGTFRDHGRPYRETDTPMPDDLYGTCKAIGESVWSEGGGATCLRIANVYGAGCGVDLGVSGAVERFARAAATGGELTIYGEGAQRIDYVHIDDVCEAFRLALEAPPAALPAAINVGSGAPVTIRELAEACVRAGRDLGASPRIVQVPPPEGKMWPDRCLSVELARATLGWSPRVELDDGVRELVGMMKRTA